MIIFKLFRSPVDLVTLPIFDDLTQRLKKNQFVQRRYAAVGYCEKKFSLRQMSGWLRIH